MMERKGELTAFWFEYSGISISAEVVWAAGLSCPLCRVHRTFVCILRPESIGTWRIQSNHVDAKINFPQFKMSLS